MFAKLSSVVIILAGLGVLGCSSNDAPDARQLPPVGSADAAVAVADAKPADAAMAAADARPVDAPTGGTPDAKPAVDAPVMMPDAPLMMPDAMEQQPDASEAQPDAMVGGPTAATLLLNEVSGGIPGGMDLVELLVTGGGTLSGITLYQNITADVKLLATLPDVEVAEGDIIVIHLKNPDVTDELTANDDCTDAACYDNAWDFVGEDGDSKEVGYSGRVLYILSAPPESYLDAVPFVRHDNVTIPAVFAPDLQYITADGPPGNEGIDFWKVKCASPCDNMMGHEQNLYDAAVDWTGTGNDPTGMTIQRKPDGVNDHVPDDWQPVGPQTLGLPN